MAQGGEQPVDADRGAGRRHPLAEEAEHQVVVAAAAEDGAELRRIEEDRLEDRAGVVGEAAGDREVEGHLPVAVAERVEMARDRVDGADRLAGAGQLAEDVAELVDDLGAAVGADGEEALDPVDLVGGEGEAGDEVARLVEVAGGELLPHLLDADLVELVQDPEDVDAALGRDVGEGEEQVQERAGGEADAEGVDLQGAEGVAHAGDHLGVPHLRLDAHRVEVELGELAEAPVVGFVGAPYRRGLVAAERPRQVRVLGADRATGGSTVAVVGVPRASPAPAGPGRQTMQRLAGSVNALDAAFMA
jgi:hypothetical protein